MAKAVGGGVRSQEALRQSIGALGVPAVRLAGTWFGAPCRRSRCSCAAAIDLIDGDQFCGGCGTSEHGAADEHDQMVHDPGGVDPLIHRNRSANI
jgi:hypothetical protein